MKKIRAASLLIILIALLSASNWGLLDLAGDDGQAVESSPQSSGSTAPGQGQSLRDEEPPARAVPTARPATQLNQAEPEKPQWAKLAQAMSWESRDLRVTRHPEGHTSVHGGGRFTQMAAGVRDASGKLVIQCFSDYTAMDDALSGRTRPVPPPDKEIEYEVSDY